MMCARTGVVRARTKHVCFRPPSAAAIEGTTAGTRSSGCVAAPGFTVVELLIAMAIMMTMMGAVFAVVNPSHGTFQAQLEVADMHQRLRVAVDELSSAIRMAGAGPEAVVAGAPLSASIAPIMPHRIGARGGEAGVFRAGTIALLYVPVTAAQGTIRAADGGEGLQRNASDLIVNARPYCRSINPLCGFAAGMRAILFDRHGAWDLVTITGLLGDTLQISYDGALSTSYANGSFIAEVRARTYYLQADTRTNTYQLRRYDGYASDLPVVDDVVGLEVEYFGDPNPPQRVPGRALSDPRGPWTTYGPPPPELEVDNPADAWGPGENCAFAAAGGEHVPRLAWLGSGGPVRLNESLLTDGPWCPDASFANRYDADLLRIRRVHVILRVQVAAAALRGPAGALFSRGGTSTSAQRFVPDIEVRFDVTPRNM
jgi:hypothetical protein